MRSCPDPLRQIRVILLDSGCTDQPRRICNTGRMAIRLPGGSFSRRTGQLLLENLHADKLRIDRLDYLSDWLEQKSGL